MIRIEKPVLEQKNGKAVLSSSIHFNDSVQTIWYESAEELGAYFCTERADAFLVAVLPYALLKGEDIVSDAPVSAKLLYSVRHYQIPFMTRVSDKYSNINITCEASSDRLETAGHIGTGISCGVDSLSTLIEHGVKESNPSYKIDTLALFNAGHYGNDEQKSSLRFQKYVANAKQFAAEFGYNLIQVDSNVGHIIDMDFVSSVSFLITSVVLSLQKYFSVYVFASTYSIFPFSPIFEDSETYDLITTQNVSTENLTIFSGCTLLTRVEKTRIISEYPEVFRHVYPCVNGDPPHNCGYCEKCRYTIMALDVMDKLDLAEIAFDMTYYRKNRTRLYGFMLLHKKDWIDKVNAPLYREIHAEMKRNHKHMPFGARLYLPIELYRAKVRLPIRHFLHRVLASVLGEERALKYKMICFGRRKGEHK